MGSVIEDEVTMRCVSAPSYAPYQVYIRCVYQVCISPTMKDATFANLRSNPSPYNQPCPPTVHKVRLYPMNIKVNIS